VCTENSDADLPHDIEFKSPLTGPPQTVVLYGDPTKPGVFVSRVKFSGDPPVRSSAPWRPSRWSMRLDVPGPGSGTLAQPVLARRAAQLSPGIGVIVPVLRAPLACPAGAL